MIIKKYEKQLFKSLIKTKKTSEIVEKQEESGFLFIMTINEGYADVIRILWNLE